MSLWKIAWRSIQQRGVASVLTMFSMALGVMLVVAVLLVHGVVTESFRNNSSLGYNMIVGAKGGKLQLVLNTVYYLSQPVENIPYEFYLDFLSKEEIEDLVDKGIHTSEEVDALLERRKANLTRSQARDLAEMTPQEQRDYLLDGRYSKDAAGTETNLAIPVLLGDYYKQYRVVGTSPKLFDELEYIPEENRKFAFAEGRNFKHWTAENGFTEAVAGYTVAKEYNLKLGDKLVASHGAAEGEGDLHEESAFTLVGILAPSGTPNDRAVFVNMEGFFLMEGHAKPVLEDELPATEEDFQPAEEGAANEDEDSESEHNTNEAESDDAEQDTSPAENSYRKKMKQLPLPMEEREVTAILFRCKDPFASMAYTNEINEGTYGQAVLPIAEIYSLLEMIVQPIQMLLLVITTMVCVVSGVSILVSIYNSMNERKHEIAVMRALGAGRPTVMAIVLLEAIIISVIGGLLGGIAGHGLIASYSGQIEERTGVSIGFFDFAPSIALYDIFGWRESTFCTIMLIAGAVLLVLAVILWAMAFKLPKISAALSTISSALAVLAVFALALGFVGPSIEFLIVPPLLVLAVLVGFLPAITAYRTDVAKSLQ